LNRVTILGGGPAGASAAIAACGEGSAVRLIEKSKFPRHKVCGEFFSPEIAQDLDRLQVWDAFVAAGAARIRRMILHFGQRDKTCPLPESGWGLSRHAFDALLLDRALALGAEICRESAEEPRVIASGRRTAGLCRGRRLFGFKAHFEGPANDAVELFFFRGCYAGVSAIEGGRTNVCGLGPEDFFKRFDFEYDAVVAESPALASRLAPLRRTMKWLSTGPLQYGQAFNSPHERYRAGDTLSFVDPFTGSGLLAAVRTGALAGVAAARSEPVSVYMARCRASLKKPFEVAGIFRAALDLGWADWLAGLVPGRLLFALTRPH